MKRVFMFVLLFATLGFCAFAQAALSLEQAISSTADDISNRLNAGTRIAVLNFSTTSVNMAEHVLEELNNALVNAGRLMVVDRRNLSVRQQELNFQMSGDVSDATAQSIGRTLGVQMIVSGSMGLSGTQYRFRVQVLEVETAAVLYSRTQNVQNDRVVQSLMGSSGVLADFTPGERIGASVMNLAFGIGSFALQNDTRGGALTAAFEGIGVVAMITAQLLKSVWAPDWPIIETYYAYPYYIGLASYVGGAIYGIIRPLTYHKPGATIAGDPLPWNIAVVPDNRGNTMVQLSYTFRW